MLYYNALHEAWIKNTVKPKITELENIIIKIIE